MMVDQSGGGGGLITLVIFVVMFVSVIRQIMRQMREQKEERERAEKKRPQQTNDRAVSSAPADEIQRFLGELRASTEPPRSRPPTQPSVAKQPVRPRPVAVPRQAESAHGFETTAERLRRLADAKRLDEVAVGQRRPDGMQPQVPHRVSPALKQRQRGVPQQAEVIEKKAPVSPVTVSPVTETQRLVEKGEIYSKRGVMDRIDSLLPSDRLQRAIVLTEILGSCRSTRWHLSRAIR